MKRFGGAEELAGQKGMLSERLMQRFEGRVEQGTPGRRFTAPGGADENMRRFMFEAPAGGKSELWMAPEASTTEPVPAPEPSSTTSSGSVAPA